MKCYYNHTQHHLLNYFYDPTLDDAVIYAGDIPFWYNIEGRYTEFIDNLIGTVFYSS